MSARIRWVLGMAALVSASLALFAGNVLAATELHVWPIGWTAAMQQYVRERVNPDFQAKYPGVEIVITPVGWNDATEKLTIAIAAGVPPDIVTTGGTTVISYVPRGMLLPLDRFLEQWENYDRVYPGAWENARWEGKTYSVPFTVDLRLTAYHKDVFLEVGLDPERPPQSWEELETAVRLTTKIDGDTVVRRGVAFSTAMGDAGLAQRFGHLVIQAGGRLISDDARTPLFNDEIGRDALEFMKRLYDLGHPAGYRSPPSTGISAFAAQQIAIELAASYVTPQNLFTQAPDLVSQLGAYPPRRSSEHPPVALAFINGHGIPAASKQPELAWAYIEHLLTPENARAFVELSGFMMPRRDLAEWIQEHRPALVPWFSAMDHVVAWPQVPGEIRGYTTLSEWIARALLGEVAPGIALQQAEAAQITLFNEYWAEIEGRAGER